MSTLRPAAFDAFASNDDVAFSDTRLGRLLRARVWRRLGEAFPPGSHVLEMACGTGVDALWLANRGVRVTATDGSPQMVEATHARILRQNLADLVTVRRQSLQSLCEQDWPASPPFDGAYSNFGGLNTLPDLSPLACSLAQAIRPGGKLVLVPMGPACPWEVVWHLAHGDRSIAWRRFRQPAPARIGDQTIPIWYPSLRRLRKAFAPWFEYTAGYSLGLLLPPSYLGHLVERHPRLFAALERIESTAARLTASWGDHYIALFSRTLTSANRSSLRSPSRAGG